MRKIFGFVIGILWIGLAVGAYRNSMTGWTMGSDLGFWWTVIGVFLTLAAGAAIIGTWLHTRPRAD